MKRHIDMQDRVPRMVNNSQLPSGYYNYSFNFSVSETPSNDSVNEEFEEEMVVSDNPLNLNHPLSHVSEPVPNQSQQTVVYSKDLLESTRGPYYNSYNEFTFPGNFDADLRVVPNDSLGLNRPIRHVSEPVQNQRQQTVVFSKDLLDRTSVPYSHSYAQKLNNSSPDLRQELGKCITKIDGLYKQVDFQKQKMELLHETITYQGYIISLLETKIANFENILLDLRNNIPK